MNSESRSAIFLKIYIILKAYKIDIKAELIQFERKVNYKPLYTPKSRNERIKNNDFFIDYQDKAQLQICRMYMEIRENKATNSN